MKPRDTGAPFDEVAARRPRTAAHPDRPVTTAPGAGRLRHPDPPTRSTARRRDPRQRAVGATTRAPDRAPVVEHHRRPSAAHDPLIPTRRARRCPEDGAHRLSARAGSAPATDVAPERDAVPPAPGARDREATVTARPAEAGPRPVPRRPRRMGARALPVDQRCAETSPVAHPVHGREPA
ncbi:hypothetical protein [Saccharothrix xinjiangensis]|uniref:Uncharacterized protein n=1 Tax=Saccharothrix xinjiangensis TaxID=204798 RepID=A0ABV9Y6R9_9PSEU